ncbi:MAG: DMT family transporter [Gammaproteobacteria bacterium]|nr:MAG: DMT family transporter [Gammaproteobacteria bacterium]
MYSNDQRLGALLMTLSALMFAIMGLFIKMAAEDLGNEMVVFYRNLFGLIYLLPWLLRGGLGHLRSKRLGLHVTRSLLGLAAMYCFFYAIANMQLSGAVLLNFSAPLFVPVIALLWLGESVPTPVRWALLIGYIGIIMILKPDASMFDSVAGIGVASGIFAALAMTSIRRMSDTEPTTRIVFYYSVISTLVSAIPLSWAWQSTSADNLLYMLIAGIAATSGQLLMTRAYAHAPAARVGPFMYLTVVFAAIFGWLIWTEVPDLLSFIGAALVVIAGVLSVRLVRPARNTTTASQTDPGKSA